MEKVIVWLNGCDDSTRIEIEVTPEQKEFLKRIEVLSAEESKYGCQPKLEVVSAH